MKEILGWIYMYSVYVGGLGDILVKFLILKEDIVVY